MCSKKISIVSPCYNEEGNVHELYLRIKKQFELLPKYSYELIFIDNASTDSTVSILRNIASIDSNVKVIVNLKNFGHIRSPYYALTQAQGDAVILMASDLQDPPELLPQFISMWEQGHNVVVGIKNKSKENPLMYALRCLFYSIIKRFSETDHISNFTGFGLYDKSFIDVLRNIKDPYPYLRGIVAEYSTNRGIVYYTQPQRKKGKTKNNFYTLYDIGMLGFVNHSKLPLRLASFIGFWVALISLLVAFVYFIYKLIYWNDFTVGSAPLVIGLFFFSAIQLIFIGIIGEYIGAIFTEVRQRPLVIEKERINF